jgi:hypothetical protein
MPHQRNVCDICRSQCVEHNSAGDSFILDCVRCGAFEISGTAAADFEIERQDARKVALVSGWIREQGGRGERVQLNSRLLERVISASFPNLQQRIEFYLQLAVKLQGPLNNDFNSTDPALVSASYSINVNEMAVIRRYLIEKGFVEVRGGDRYRVSAAGFLEADRRAEKASLISDAFVAMWFDEQMHQIYHAGIAPGVQDAGYRPIRVDLVEHAGKIDDEIIAQIRRARFLIADFTGQRAGVYFEAGFAMGLGKTVVWSCRADEIPNLHFDIRQYNCIDWRTPEELRRRLSARISAVIGDGPLRQ